MPPGIEIGGPIIIPPGTFICGGIEPNWFENVIGWDPGILAPDELCPILIGGRVVKVCWG